MWLMRRRLFLLLCPVDLLRVWVRGAVGGWLTLQSSGGRYLCVGDFLGFCGFVSYVALSGRFVSVSWTGDIGRLPRMLACRGLCAL